MGPESYSMLICPILDLLLVWSQAYKKERLIVVISAGDLHWKVVSVYINRLNQVSLSMLKPKALSDFPLEILVT